MQYIRWAFDTSARDPDFLLRGAALRYFASKASLSLTQLLCLPMD
jgi:hypothetical protein